MLYAKTPDDPHGQPAGKKQRAICPNCGEEVIGKFGEIVVPHWAHKANRDCDPWAEPEGPWHRNWKALVRPDNCEVTIRGQRDGKEVWHRADIVNAHGTVIELQHSSISPETIAQREAFYGDMVWVFDLSMLARESHRVDLLGRQVEDVPRLLVASVMDEDDLFDQIVELCPPTVCNPLLLNPELNAFFERDHHQKFIFARPPRLQFRWKHARRSLEFVTKPFFIDLGPKKNGFGLPGFPQTHRMLKVISFETTPQDGTVLVVEPLHYHRFLKTHLYGALKPAPQAEVDHAHKAAICRIQMFRALRHQARAFEAWLRAEEEREREEKRERQRLLQAEEERERRAFRDWIRQQDYDTLCRYNLANLSSLRREVWEQVGTPRVRMLEDEMDQNLFDMPADMKSRLLRGLHQRLQACREKVYKLHSARLEEDSVIVRGPFDFHLKIALRALGFKWDPDRRCWWVNYTRYLEGAQRLVDWANENRAREFLSPKKRFIAACLVPNPRPNLDLIRAS